MTRLLHRRRRGGEITGWLVTEGFFEMLGVNAAHGRTFLPEEYLPGSGVIVLTDALWQRRFGGEADIIGCSLMLEGEPHTVVGVLGPDFELGLERGSAAARQRHSDTATG